MLKTLLDKPGEWITRGGPEIDTVVNTRGTLARNIADLPFPGRCSEDEKRAVQERALAAIETAGLNASGTYVAVTELHVRELRMLIERHLITRQLIEGRGPRGVFIANDQSYSILVNERDHLRLCAFAGGLQPDEVWQTLSQLDDALALSLDYAYHEKRGFLTSSLDEVGTGLKLTATLHLPAVAANKRVFDVEQNVRAEHHTLDGVFDGVTDAAGNFYVLTNRGTLGRSEGEIAFHLRTLAIGVRTHERNAREAMITDNAAALSDRVGRALGVARGARLLDFREGLSLLSSIRLGVATAQVESLNYPILDEVLVTSQPAHIECKLGAASDDLALSIARADLFRGSFS